MTGCAATSQASAAPSDRRYMLKKLELFFIQKGKCFHCGEAMLMGPATPNKYGKRNRGWTKEHIIPVSKGGKNIGNVVLSHFHCNQERGNSYPTEQMVARCAEIWKQVYENQKNGNRKKPKRARR